MSAAPELSVIVTTHNVVDWIGECLSSILDGQSENIEVIIVDDRSTDGTWEIGLARATLDCRVRAVRGRGYGGGQARNYGVDLARAPYIAFCDGDDLVPPQAYEIMLRSARANQPDMVVGNFLKFSAIRTWCPTRRWSAFNDERNGVGIDSVPAVIRNRACWNRLIRRDFWLERDIYFPSVPRSNDIVPMTKALLESQRINVIPDIVYLYRERPGGTSMTAMADQTTNLFSYLSQEHICARLVETANNLSLSRIYWDMFLNSDGWVHLHRYLRNFDPSAEPHQLVALTELLRAFLELAPERQWQRLAPERQCLFALCGMGEFATAAALFRTMDGDDAVDASVAAARWLNAIDILKRHPAVTGQTLQRIARRRILHSLLSGASGHIDMAVASCIAKLGPEFADLIEADVGDPHEERLLSALRLADPHRVLRVLTRQKQRAVQALSLSVDGRVARITGECPAGIEPDACTVIITPTGDPGSAIEAGAATATPGGDGYWVFDLRQSAIPACGGWQVSLQFDDGLGVLRIPVLILRSHIHVSAKPWHHLAVVPVDTAQPIHLAVFKRGSLVRRGAGKVARSARRRGRPINLPR